MTIRIPYKYTDEYWNEERRGCINGIHDLKEDIKYLEKEYHEAEHNLNDCWEDINNTLKRKLRDEKDRLAEVRRRNPQSNSITRHQDKVYELEGELRDAESEAE